MKNNFSFCSVSYGGQLQQGTGEAVNTLYSTIHFNICEFDVNVYTIICKTGRSKVLWAVQRTFEKNGAWSC